MKRAAFCVILLSAAFHSGSALAQCSMCRAVAGSSRFSDDAFMPGQGLNDAILYLMGMPYLLAALFVALFFRKQIAAYFSRLRQRGNPV